jgi:hypothetical protein
MDRLTQVGDTARARAIAQAKSHMSRREQQAFDRFLRIFPGTTVHTFIPVVQSR